jgi:hypothetical protein
VRSDCFFEDFDLRFTFVAGDEYELAPDSAQRVQKEIYVARVAPSGDSSKRVEAIRSFLVKSPNSRRDPPVLQRMLSVSDGARDGRLSSEHFPRLCRPGGRIIELSTLPADTMKGRILRELVDRALGLAIFDAPFDQAEIARSEVHPRLVLLDDGQAAPAALVDAYLFGAGVSRALVGNAVDGAPDLVWEEHVGLLALGVSVGQWHLRVPFIESRLFGDPTFAYATVGRSPSGVDPFADRGIDEPTLDTMLDPRGPEVLRALAVRIAERRGEAMEETFAKLARDDSAQIVRLQALASLARLRSNALDGALIVSISDPSELVRLRSARLMGEVGRTESIARLLRAFLRDPSPRVVASARDALCLFDLSFVKLAVDEYVQSEGALAAMIGAEGTLAELVSTADTRSAAALRALESPKLDARERATAIETFRTSHVHRALPPLLALATKSDEDVLVRRAAIDALGGFQYSVARALVTTKLRALAADDNAPKALRDEASKTIKRLDEGPNSPLWP